MQGEKASIFSAEQEQQLVNLKRHFPWRICWGAVNAETGEFRTGAHYTRKSMYSLLRKGWLVYEAKSA